MLMNVANFLWILGSGSNNMTAIQANFTNTSSNTLNNSYINNTGRIVNNSIETNNDKGNVIVCLSLGIVVVIENSLVCLAFALNRKLRKRQANILVCSQACADLFNGLVFVPIEVYERYRRQRLLTPYLIAYLLFVSLFNLFSLALDRYLALIKPLFHHLIMDVNKTKKLLIVNWLVPLLITAIPLCWSSSSLKTKAISGRVYVCIFWLFMFLLCVIMIVMYVLIYRTAAKTIRQRQKRMAKLNKDPENKIKTTRTELRVAHLFGLLLFFFILAYLPILYLNLMDILDQVHLIFPVIEQLSLYSLIVNSVVNPILCLLLKKDYQLIIKRWICLEWIADKRRGGSIHSQASYKTVMENIAGQDSSSDSSRKKRISRAHSLRRSDHNDNNKSLTQVIRYSLTRRRSTNRGPGRDGGVSKTSLVKTGDIQKNGEDKFDALKIKSGAPSTNHCLSSVLSDTKHDAKADSKRDIRSDPKRDVVQKMRPDSQNNIPYSPSGKIDVSARNNNSATFRIYLDKRRLKGDCKHQRNSVDTVELLEDKCQFTKSSDSDFGRNKDNTARSELTETKEESICEIQPMLS